ncbi:MAG: hypothetical protein RMX35_15875 [Nostoc sp. DcaGUA01]|nr:hypothetical protein [Nostoc sp. DcaGUA01]
MRSPSPYSASLWFVKKSDRLQNLYSAIALFFPLYPLRLCGSLKRAIAYKTSTV